MGKILTRICASRQEKFEELQLRISLAGAGPSCATSRLTVQTAQGLVLLSLLCAIQLLPVSLFLFWVSP